MRRDPAIPCPAKVVKALLDAGADPNTSRGWLDTPAPGHVQWRIQHGLASSAQAQDPLKCVEFPLVREMLKSPSGGARTDGLSWLSEEQLEKIKPVFPKSRGVSCVDDRKMLSGIIHMLRSGLRPRGCPSHL